MQSAQMTVWPSPHTRGAPDHSRRATQLLRIIPAYAGSTSGPVRAGVGCGIIPAYAGSTRHCPATAEDFGSSPHTRGAPAGRADALDASRIIPAYAGSTPCPLPPILSDRIIPAYAGSTRAAVGVEAMSVADHPRIRGEHWPQRSPQVPLPDHPRIRGEHSGGRCVCRLDLRIIPAYAGSTSPATPTAADSADHPRIRGEHHQNESQ